MQVLYVRHMEVVYVSDSSKAMGKRSHKVRKQTNSDWLF
jgi:hypothetical protein